MGNRGRRSHRLTVRVASSALLALTGLFALLLSACATSGGGAVLAQSQVFTWSYVNASAVQNPTQHVAVFDPAVITTATDSSNIAMLYSGLVTLDSATLQVKPDAASSWTVDSTGTKYTFTLRPNLSFSDGHAITAQDFAYSINRALANNAGVCNVDDAKTYGAPNSSCAALGSGYLNMILGEGTKGDPTVSGTQSNNTSLIGSGKGLDPIDTQTLVIRLAHPAAYFLEALYYPTSYPVEQSLVDKYPGGTWVDHLDEGGCSGPFMVKAYIPGKELKLVPNPYWESAWHKHITLTEVDRPFLASQDTEYDNYHKAGEYDYTDVPPDVYTFALGQADFHEVPSLTTDYFGLNFNQPPFNDVRIRQAFDLALNKQLLVDRVFNGGAIPTNHIVPEGMPGFDPQLTGPDGTQSVTGNQQKAVQLLQEAQNDCKASGNTQTYCPYIDNGANSQPIYLSAGTITDASQKEIATIATQTWSQVLNLNVQVKAYIDLSDLVSKVIFPTPSLTNPNGLNTAQAWQIGWLADYPDPQDWLSLQFHTGAGNNVSYVNDSHLNSLMDQADQEQNQAKRMAEYNTIEQDMVNLCAWIPYAQEKTGWRLRPWVHGFALNEVLIMEDVDWPNVYITAH
jgi:peptide/nickel transport system substrate-binding protein/oligopeptide transport system substrate-binding protein